MLIENARAETRQDTPDLSGLGQSRPNDAASETQNARSIELRAAVLLHSHPHLQRYSHEVQCCFRNRCLYLAGAMPSFYLKQLAQESLRGLPGIERIENRIAVIKTANRVSNHSESFEYRMQSRPVVAPKRPR